MRLTEFNRLLIFLASKVQQLYDVHGVDCEYSVNHGDKGLKVTFNFYDIDGYLFCSDSTAVSEKVEDQYESVEHLINYFLENTL